MAPRIKAFGALFCLVLALPWADNAIAHRLNTGLSVVESAPSGTQVEITHRLFAHDVENLFPKKGATRIAAPEVQRVLETYAKAHFVIGYDGNPVPQHFVGAERDGAYVYIYLTVAPPHGHPVITIWNTLLQDELPDQKNLTNVHLDGTKNTFSLYSTRSNPAKNLVIWPD